MQTDTKQLEAYDNIIQNLFALKGEAIKTWLRETDTKQIEVYDRIIQNLFTLEEEAKSSRSDRRYIVYALRPARLSAWPQFVTIFYYPPIKVKVKV